MTHPAAVLFDCDGVIVNSEPPTLALLQAELAAHGLPMTLHELEARFIGGTIERVATRARAAGASLPPDWVPGFYQRLYARLAEGCPLIPGIVPVLDALDQAGIPYAVGSNGPPEKMVVTLGMNGLLARFGPHVHSGQALGAPKPAPDVYLHAARTLGVDPATCVVVEDSATGARAARAAGMRCMGFAAAGGSEGLAAVGAEVFLRMEDLPGLLGL